MSWKENLAEKISLKMDREMSRDDALKMIGEVQIEGLTLEWSVVKADTPNAPGALKMRCGTSGVVLMMVRFKQAPQITIEHEVETKHWSESMAPNFAMQAVPPLIKALMHVGQQNAKPSIILAGESDVPK